jgi:thioesterase domain-containing protein
MTAQYFADKTTPVSGTVIPVGRPVANTHIFLRDDTGEISAICGEICIRSAYLTPGYWQADDLTALAFETDDQGRRLYRTGDHARYRYDGELVYTGRRDGQVKIRGHRIERAEIEQALNKLDTVGKSAILLVALTDGEQSMVAYLTPTAGKTINLEQVRMHLRECLPVYMMPAGFVELDELPLTPNGKIDRQALPAYVIERDHTTQLVEAQTPTEKSLARIWKKLLKVDELGIYDDFFSLGGHSLLTIRLIREIEKDTGHTLTIASVFEQPNIARLAALIDSGEVIAALPGSKTLMPIRTGGTRTPLFCIDGEPMRMASSLSADQPLYGLYHAYDPDFEPPDTITELAEVYIREMRRVQPHGPYRLVGFCVGGLVAYDVVRQLQEVGESVDYLALIDPTIPGRRGGSRAKWVRNTFAQQQKKTATAWYFFKRIFRAIYARMGLGQRLVRGHLRKAFGMELPLRLRHVQNVGKIRQSHRGYRYSEIDQKAVIFLVDMEPDLWTIYSNFWRSVFLQGADMKRIKGLKGHTEFLNEPFISNVTRIIEDGIVDTDSNTPAASVNPTPQPESIPG